MIDSYPLQWPAGFPRCKAPIRSRFGRYDYSNRKATLTLFKGRHEVYEQVRLLIGKRSLDSFNCIISTNMKTRKSDGGVYANAKEPDDSGVAVYFVYEKEQHVLACDQWATVKENLHAIAKTVDAIRGLDRWGVSDMLKRIFTGFIGITDDAGKGWASILGVGAGATREELQRAYHNKMKTAHTDVGGSDEYAATVNIAYERALLELTNENRE